jgi:hypothetical protein
VSAAKKRREPVTGSLTMAEIASVFTRWEKAYRENPEAFEGVAHTPRTYGNACARHFVRLLREAK